MLVRCVVRGKVGAKPGLVLQVDFLQSAVQMALSRDSFFDKKCGTVSVHMQNAQTCPLAPDDLQLAANSDTKADMQVIPLPYFAVCMIVHFCWPACACGCPTCGMCMLPLHL